MHQAMEIKMLFFLLVLVSTKFLLFQVMDGLSLTQPKLKKRESKTVRAGALRLLEP